ncbi:MAG: PLP-dependent aminotransferase family protein [Coprothermobacterota bacterium]|nr:PLP-dependent aminotransferase family protein [Coprothermobacterota bacterium]
MLSNWSKDIVLTPKQKGQSLSRQLAQSLEIMIDNGQIQNGQPLPPVRKLAELLSVNRGIVLSAYRILAEGGRVTTHVGRGTRVAELSPNTLPHSLQGLSLPAWEAIGDLLSPPPYASLLAAPYSFAPASPDSRCVPARALASLATEVIAKESQTIFSYGPAQGDPGFRAQVARSLRDEGLEVDATWVLPISGATQAWDLVSRLFAAQDCVLLEDPCYPGAVRSFRARPQTVAWYPVGEEGATLELLEKAIVTRQARLLCINPDFHNPTGNTLSIEARREVARLARQYQLLILEDGIFRDLNYNQECSYPPIFAFAPERTLLVSSFSKVLAPGLRLGTVVATPGLVEKLAWLKQAMDYQTSALSQAVVRAWMAQGWREYLRTIQAVYRQKRDRLAAALRRELPPEVHWREPEGGFFYWLSLPSSLDAENLLYQASREGVAFLPGSFFGGGPGSAARWRHFLRLSFSAIATESIEPGAALLGRILREQSGSELYSAAPLF